ncbi:hypothetical protein HPB51_003657 [Rhipicephalus microplus]|uniref:Uncharacterized protein n=1 Tax=Rhipicephalus microplus TaxID=6941 RepID=A0A9J6DYB3_RHIMP|nr:hypothetical protein HPB51_003657 [Rhipicephalus microplus]
MHQPEIERQRPGRDDGLVHQQRLLHCFLMGCNVGLVLFYLYGVYSHANNALERTVPRREPGLDNNGALPDLATTPLHANETSGLFCAATRYPVCPAEPSVPHETMADSAWIKGDDADAFDAKRDGGSEDAPTEPRRPDFRSGYLWTYRNAYADTPPAAGRQSAGFPDGLIRVSRNWFGSFADAIRRLYDVLRYALGFETFRPQFSSIAGCHPVLC